MTILSDKTIHILCSDRYGIHTVTDQFGREKRTYLSAAEADAWLNNHNTMSWRYGDGSLECAEYPGRLEIVSNKPMISPFVAQQIRTRTSDTGVAEPVISYGVSSYGYDFRIAPEFRIFTNVNSTMVDPKNPDPLCFIEHRGPHCIIPPNSFALARTLERFDMPPDVTGLCLGKSTIARTGINCLATPVEAGWSGYLTLEYSNNTPLPAKLYAHEGGLQVVFVQGEQLCDTTYSERKGKYSDQPPAIVGARV